MVAPTYDKIFLMGYPGIGDFVFVIPTLHSLRRNLPTAKIYVGVSKNQLPIAQTLEDAVIDALVIQQHAGMQIREKIKDIVYFVKHLRTIKPDIYIDLQGGYRLMLMGWLSSAKRSIHLPYEETKPIVRELNGEKLPLPDSRHRVDIYLQLLRYIGFPTGKICFDFQIPEQGLERAETLIKKYQLRGRGLIALMQESSPWKKWSKKSFQETIDTLTEDMGQEVVIFGKRPSDSITRKRVIDLRGKTSLFVDSQLLRYSGLFKVIVGPDTGMMLIAGSINSNEGGTYNKDVKGNLTVSLFGPSDPTMYAPYDPTGSFNLVVASNLEGVKRDILGIALDKGIRNYMEEITTQMIVGSIKQQLRKDKVEVNQT